LTFAFSSLVFSFGFAELLQRDKLSYPLSQEGYRQFFDSEINRNQFVPHKLMDYDISFAL